jgi:predicted RNA-binding Zn ribbon-like protein
MSVEQGPGELTLLAGELCLDFANTAEWHASDQPYEHLDTYNDLVAWAEHAKLIRAEQAGRLRRQAAEAPEAAERTLQEAITLRETIYRIFTAVASGEDPTEADLARLNIAFSNLLPRTHLSPDDGSYEWLWVEEGDDLDLLLFPILRSAVQLLTSGELDRVGQCADDRGCGWLFLDMSRNRSRRWCDMEDCGNRAKAKRYYERHREDS